MKKCSACTAGLLCLVFLSGLQLRCASFSMEKSVIQTNIPSFSDGSLLFNVHEVYSPGALLQESYQRNYGRKAVDADVTIKNISKRTQRVDLDSIMIGGYLNAKTTGYPAWVMWDGHDDHIMDTSRMLQDKVKELNPAESLSVTLRYLIDSNFKIGGINYNKNPKNPIGNWWYIEKDGKPVQYKMYMQ
ncbi:MAG: hypothetical protein JXA20_14180 [Spirochaetes bacterium]|nr:hypothetical protein [Spirochaetota bacterium]